jgi:hypothetical protein
VTQQHVSRLLRFGRFLRNTPAGLNLRITEWGFRKEWDKTSRLASDTERLLTFGRFLRIVPTGTNLGITKWGFRKEWDKTSKSRPRARPDFGATGRAPTANPCANRPTPARYPRMPLGRDRSPVDARNSAGGVIERRPHPWQDATEPR